MHFLVIDDIFSRFRLLFFELCTPFERVRIYQRLGSKNCQFEICKFYKTAQKYVLIRFCCLGQFSVICHFNITSIFISQNWPKNENRCFDTLVPFIVSRYEFTVSFWFLCDVSSAYCSQRYICSNFMYICHEKCCNELKSLWEVLCL